MLIRAISLASSNAYLIGWSAVRNGANILLMVIITTIPVLPVTLLSVPLFSKRFDSSGAVRIAAASLRLLLCGRLLLEAIFDFGHGPGARAAHCCVAIS